MSSSVITVDFGRPGGSGSESVDVHTSHPDKYYLYKKLVETILLQPALVTSRLVYRTIKLLAYIPLKSLVVVVSQGSANVKKYLAGELIKTVKAARDVFTVPLKVARVVNDIRSPSTQFRDDNPILKPKDYLKTDYSISFQHFSSEHFPSKNFKVITPKQIKEMPAPSDPSLQAVMGSHFLQKGMMGINFGCPNVALFTTHESKGDEGSIYKVDAKSLKREEMQYRDTKGKLQSGVFFIPTNLPEDAIEALKSAAEKLKGRRDLTCVNTNCRILKEAGFTMDGVDLEDCYMPTTFMENVLFRNMYYKGQKIHFDIVKTTPLTLQEYFEEIDNAILTTPFRHWTRNYDSKENREARERRAKEIMAQEKEDLSTNPLISQAKENSETREVKVSVTSSLGNFFARLWGRHLVYEINLSDKEQEITQLFENRLLKPFPEKKPSFLTRLKRDFFFSKAAINFIRRHMLGRQDAEQMEGQDILRLLKSSGGARLNYVLLRDKIVIARVNVATNNEKLRKAADWALSKHALLANREEIACSGEIWYDQNSDRFLLNGDSGTYKPEPGHVEKVVKLANEIFQTDRFEISSEESK